MALDEVMGSTPGTHMVGLVDVPPLKPQASTVSSSVGEGPHDCGDLRESCITQSSAATT